MPLGRLFGRILRRFLLRGFVLVPPPPILLGIRVIGRLFRGLVRCRCALPQEEKGGPGQGGAKIPERASP